MLTVLRLDIFMWLCHVVLGDKGLYVKYNCARGFSEFGQWKLTSNNTAGISGLIMAQLNVMYCGKQAPSKQIIFVSFVSSKELPCSTLTKKKSAKEDAKSLFSLHVLDSQVNEFCRLIVFAQIPT